MTQDDSLSSKLTQQARHVADSEAIRLPTLKELIGYPTTYYDDLIATTSSSILLHLLRNDVDSDISQQNVESLNQRIDESQDSKKEIAQSTKGIIEETSDSWLWQASENKARSRAPRKEDITNSDEGVSVTNTIQGDENKRKTPTTAIYLKPTTMRGIPLASLISNPMKRWFYITTSENDLSSSILADSSTPSYTTIHTPVEQQTETTLISDISTTDEIVTIARNDRIESGSNVPNNNVNDIINNKGDTHEENYLTSSSSVIFSKDSDNAENLFNHKKSDLITVPVDRPASKRGKSRNFDQNTTPLFNTYVISPTTPTRRRIDLAVKKYNEATIPLWTGKRIVVKKRNRTTVSSIKDAITQTESDLIRATTSTLKSASLNAKSASTLTSKRLFTTSTIPMIPLIVPDSMISPEALGIHNSLANSNDTKTEDSEHAIVAAVTLANSVIAATPSILKTVIPMTNDSTTADISTFSDDPTTIMVSTTPSTVAVAKSPAVATDATITTTSAEVETTSLNYSVTDNPTIENTNTILSNSAATTAFAESIETEIISTNINSVVPETMQTATDPAIKSTTTSTGVKPTSTMINYSIMTIPTTANTQAIATDSVVTTEATTETTSENVNSVVPVTTQMIATDPAITTKPTAANTDINSVVPETMQTAIKSTAASTGVKTTSTMINYSIMTIPTIANTQAIATDSAVTTEATTETTSKNVNSVVPVTTQMIATDPAITTTAIKPTAANTEVKTTFTMTNSITTIPANAQEIETDSANITTVQITNADIGATSTITNYSAIAIPTTISTHDVVTDSAIPITAGIETISMIENDSTFTTTTIPVTTAALPLTTVISPTVNTQYIDATAPMTTSNLADKNTVTANTITTTTPLSVIIPTITDLNVITTSANANISSTSAISKTLPTTIQSRTSSVTSPEAPITSTVVTSTSSAAPTTLTESSMIHLANPNNVDISSNSEAVTVTVTAESTQTTETPTTFETPLIFTSTESVFPKPLPSTNFEASVMTTASSIQGDENSLTSMITQTPSALFSIATSITNKATVALERSTTSATLSATSGESIKTNHIIPTTTNVYEDSVQTINEESITPGQKVGYKEATSTETQSRTKDQTTTTIKNPSFARTSDESTTPEMKVVSEKAVSKAIESRKQNQTTSELNTTNYQFSKKTARRRVLNRTNNWLGSPVTLQRTNQYPRHPVTLYREQSQRLPTYISSSKMVERNHRRRIIQKRVRVNSEAFNSTIEPDQDTVDVQNTPEDHTAYNRMANVRRVKVVLKKIKEKVDEEPTIILPTEETTILLQSSIATENETLQKDEKRKIIPKEIKQSQESFTTKEISINSSSINENLRDNSQSNLYAIPEDSYELEKSKKKMKVLLKSISTPKSDETNPIEETSADSDSINTNLQDNFPKSSSVNMNLSDKKIVGRRMRVVLKSVKLKSEEKNSTIEETNADLDSINKNLQTNLSNNFNINPNFSNEDKTRRKMRVVLKRVKAKSKEEGTKTEETSTESDSINESLQGTFSNHFYSGKNLPVEYGTRRRMRVVLKSVKPKSERRNSTVEETSVNLDSINESFQGIISNNFRKGKNLPVDYGTRRRMRVVLKSVKPRFEENNSTFNETSVNPNSANEYFQKSISSNNFRRGKSFPVEYGNRRRMRVILKSVKPKFSLEERDSTVEETSIESDSSNKDLQGSFSNNFYINENYSDEEEAQRRVGVISNSKERDSIAEEINADSNFVRRDPQVLFTFNFSSNLHVGDNLPNKEKTMMQSKSEEEEAMTKRPEDTEPQTTGTSVPVEKDTDRPSFEVTNGGSTSRNSGSGYSNRHRKPTQFTTIAPLTNTLSNTLTVHRRGRPVETTLSSRIDFVDAPFFEGTESYIKPAAVLHDQNADVSDQSIHAQEFAVTLSDPPSSSSDIGRTQLRDADRRKISTTVSPRTDPTTGRTVSRYNADFRSRQRPRTKDRPTVNATTRPRRPPVIDYDYYEDEVPIVVGKSVLNSKLFLTSKGSIRCLDQGNFPHPYSCKKFITCARMVNGQVIGTEYTCPDKLSFDPVGGICNWSAGLGCKD